MPEITVFDVVEFLTLVEEFKSPLVCLHVFPGEAEATALVGVNSVLVLRVKQAPQESTSKFMRRVEGVKAEILAADIKLRDCFITLEGEV